MNKLSKFIKIGIFIFVIIFVFSSENIFAMQKHSDFLYNKYDYKEIEWLKDNKEKELILLAFDSNDLYIYKDENGEIQGLVKEIINLINSLLELNINIKTFSDIKEEHIGDYEIIGYIGNNNYFVDKENIKCTSSLITSPYLCYVKLNNKNINSLYDLNNKDVGILLDDNKTKIEELYPTYKLNKKLYNSLEEMQIDLLNGKIDAYIYNKDSKYLKFKQIKQSFAIDNLTFNVFIVFNDENKNLLGVFNKTINSLVDSDEYLQTVTNYYQSKNLDDLNILEDYEKSWINNNKEILVGLNKEHIPYEFVDKKGNYKGITVELLKEIERYTNLKFKLVDSNNIEQERLNELKSKKIDLTVAHNIDVNNDVFFTNSFANDKVVVLGRKTENLINKVDDLQNSIFVVKENSWQEEIINSIVNKQFIIKKKRMEDIYSAIQKKHADYTIEELLTASKILSDANYKDLRILCNLNVNNYQCFAVRKDYKELVSIINKVIPYININKIKEKIEITEEKKVDYTVFIITTVILLGILILIFCANFVLKQEIRKTRKNEREIEGLKNKYKYMLYSMLETIGESKYNGNNKEHINRLVEYIDILTREYGLDNEKIHKIKRYVTLHEIGYIGLSDEIIDEYYNKERLTSKDSIEFMKHIHIGYDLIKKLDLGEIPENIIKYYKEKYNGEGYPYKLKGEEIPIEARIVSVADIYDTYRMKGVEHEEVIRIMSNEKGISFDSRLIEILIDHEKEFYLIFDKLELVIINK